MGVGLGNSMGPAYHRGVPCPWGSLKIPLIKGYALELQYVLSILFYSFVGKLQT